MGTTTNGYQVERQMVFYNIDMLPLTLQLKAEVSTSLQPWHKNNASAGGNFEETEKVFIYLSTNGPAQGYFPKPKKSIIVEKSAKVECAKTRFNDLGF